jgi:hypothetical protein
MMLVLLACLQDVKDARCETACRSNGYFTGYNEAERCLCVDRYDYELYTSTKDTPPIKIKRYYGD